MAGLPETVALFYGNSRGNAPHWCAQLR